MLTGLRSCGVAFPDAVVSGGTVVDPYYSYVYGLWHLDTGYGDSGPGGRSIIATNTTTSYGIQTTKPRFGAGSLRATLNATGGTLIKVPPSSALNVTGDFTFEFWMVTAGTQGTYSNIYETLGAAGLSATAPPATALGVANWTNAAGTGTGGTTLTCYLGSGTSQLRLTSTSNPNNGQWHHIALSRTGSTCRLFFNGVQQASGTYSIALDLGATYGGSLGRYTNTGNDNIFNGYLDDLRITIGVGRYTSNFVVPSDAFPNSG